MKKCKECGSKSDRENFCSYYCKEIYENKKANEKWAAIKPVKKKSMSEIAPHASSAHAYHKEPKYLKKYKAVRG